MQPGLRRSTFVDGRAKNIISGWPVMTVLDLVLSGPDDLDGSVHRLRCFDRIGDEILLAAPPKAAAQEHGVDFHRLAGKARDAHRRSLSAGLILCSYPYLTIVFPDMGRAGHRLHGGMREKRHLIDRVHRL